MNWGPLYQLARATSEHLRQISYENNEDAALARNFADDLKRVANASLEPQYGQGAPVRALKFAPIVFDTAHENEISELMSLASSAFGLVRWTEFYAEDDWSRHFLPCLANGEGIGPDGRLRDNKINFGLCLFGPNTVYPPHAHPAEEFYLVLPGDPEFQVGARNPYLTQDPGSVVLHHSNVSHSIRMSDHPFFGIYGWRGDIHERSWYRNDMSDETEPKKFPKINKG